MKEKASGESRVNVREKQSGFSLVGFAAGGRVSTKPRSRHQRFDGSVK